METFGHENLKHPYENYCLADAVRLANAEMSLSFKPKVTSLVQAREVVNAMLKTVTHNWITGFCALDVLDAAIDGRDLVTDNRIVSSPQPTLALAIKEAQLAESEWHREDAEPVDDCQRG